MADHQWPDGTRGEKTVHFCEECFRLEGEQPQAGCCPGCGRHSDPVPAPVVPASLTKELAEKVEALTYALWGVGIDGTKEQLTSFGEAHEAAQKALDSYKQFMGEEGR